MRQVGQGIRPFGPNLHGIGFPSATVLWSCNVSTPSIPGWSLAPKVLVSMRTGP